jgi:ABC-type Fe3+/spermidine/putrescine transport system ATPase subunit
MALRPPDGASAVALSLRGVTAGRGNRTLLDDINLSLARGQRLALLGPPGAGKTALLLAVAGLLPVVRGSVLADGNDITRRRPTARGLGIARRMRQLAPSASHGLVLFDRPDAWPERGGTVVAAFADQALALSGADRVAILRDGRLLQEGAAASVYENPRSVFVARFLGGANIVAGTVREVRPGGFVLVADGLRLHFTPGPEAPRPALGARLALALRPERIGLLFGEEKADNLANGIVATSQFQGASVLLGVDTPLGRIALRLPGWRAAQAPVAGTAVRLGWAADAAVPVLED